MLIQNIGNHSFDVDYQTGEPKEQDYLMMTDGIHVYMNPETKDLYQVKDYDGDREDLVFIYELDGKKIYLPLKKNKKLMEKSLAVVMKEVEDELHYLKLAGATAMHLGGWYHNHRFCGCCGHENKPDKKERALKCTSCGHLTFPVICPAIILAIIDKENDRILLTKAANRKNARYSLISGYTEIGETIEQTCVREAFEEVGLRVKNLKYYINQPWGFSGSLMVGYFAELDGDSQVTLQEEEIAEAKWFTRDTMPITVKPMDITHHMMEMWRLGKV